MVVVGAPVALTSGPVEGWQSGPAALGADGTFWALPTSAGCYTPSSSCFFAITARAANGVSLAPVEVWAGPGGVAQEAIAAGAGEATVVWESATNDDGNSGGAWVRVRQCTLTGCAAVQTLAHWQWTLTDRGPNQGPQEPNPLPAGIMVGQWALPAVVSVGGRTIVVFGVESPTAPPTMDWAVSEGSRFGPVHSFGVAAAPNPVLVPESGGRVLAAWLNWGIALPYPRVPARRVDWSIWRPNHRFGTVHSFAAGTNALDLVGAPYQGRAALAWQADSGLLLAQQVAGAFTKPTLEDAGPGFVPGGTPSLAGGDNVLALASPTSERPLIVTTITTSASFTGLALDDNNDFTGPSALAVDAAGNTLASWQSDQQQPTGPQTVAEIAVAPAAGGFGQPTALGPYNAGYLNLPAVYTNGSQSLVLWQDQAGQLVTSQVTINPG